MKRDLNGDEAPLQSVLLIEDDWNQAQFIASSIKGAHPGCWVHMVLTESDFLAKFPSIAADPPSMVITGMMMPWSRPTSERPEVPRDIVEGPHVAGLRCIQRLASDRRTLSIPIILYTTVSKGDFIDRIPQLPVNVQYLSKNSSPERLLSLIQRFRQAIQEQPDQAHYYRAIVQRLGQALAEAIARDPSFLEQVEWRDLERTLSEVFNGLGYEAHLTRSAKDGGKDIVLQWIHNGTSTTWYVELKHWTEKRVGTGEMRHFAQVLIRDEVEHGLLLASGGFVTGSYEALSVIEQTRLNLGGKEQIINLCKTYVWARNGLWTAPDTPLELLHFQDDAGAVQGT
jgi:CheY-like chemotaxis protein